MVDAFSSGSSAGRHAAGLGRTSGRRKGIIEPDAGETLIDRYGKDAAAEKFLRYE